MTKIWSSYQTAIFDDFKNGSGNTAIDATPGAGKSTVIVEGLHHLPQSVGSVLVTSFSTQSVGDLNDKKENSDIPVPWFVDIRTMNSLGNRAVTQAFGKQNVSKDKVWGVLDEVLGTKPDDAGKKAQFNGFRARAKQLTSLAKHYLAKDEKELIDIGDTFEIDTAAPEFTRKPLSDKWGCAQDDVLLVCVLKCLEICKRINGSIDFDDQLWLPNIHNLDIEQFDYVLVDEAQDLDKAQIEMLARSVNQGGRVIMAGQDAQAIYAWRGAGLGMAPFIKKTNAKILPLSISYRCAKEIVRAAAKIMPGIEAAPDASEGSVSQITKDMLAERLKVGDTVLSRKNAPLIALFMRLLAKRIPVGMQGKAIGEGLLKFIEKSDESTVDGLLAYTNEWAKKECDRRQARNPNAKTDHITDQVECIETLCDGAKSIYQVKENCNKLLISPERKVLLSSVHKAKGLEWDRVFLLDDTFPVNTSYWLQYARQGNKHQWAEDRAKKCMAEEIEERNILYVAVTRARRELIKVMPL